MGPLHKGVVPMKYILVLVSILLLTTSVGFGGVRRNEFGTVVPLWTQMDDRPVVAKKPELPEYELPVLAKKKPIRYKDEMIPSIPPRGGKFIEFFKGVYGHR